MQESVLHVNTIALYCVVGYYLIVNAAMYIAMCVDKSHAIKKKRRIPEKNLYFLAVLGGGAAGLFAMVFKHHKNHHIDFIMVYTITSILHCIVILLLFSKLVFGL